MSNKVEIKANSDGKTDTAIIYGSGKVSFDCTEVKINGTGIRGFLERVGLLDKKKAQLGRIVVRSYDEYGENFILGNWKEL